ncbi:hypothetical protein ONZ43_g4208 [Nemania bipapillata]|uniref:Uncharacterized protein n=1 Tax=Nemania bipapillata TaxID=110536 RepID=A0ACC2IQG7_9PEZI|nr:hypothetical protein ONZ43_g4208 [Nemania bipapillata]
MMFLNILVLALVWVVRLISCIPRVTVSRVTVSRSAPINSYALANITWEGSLTEDGPTVSFTGQSMAEIRSEINKVAPGFTWPEPVTQSPHGTTRTLVKNSEHRILCNKVTRAYADYYHILDQAAQLQAMPGFCRVSPTLDGQPLSCNRLTCTGGSGIYLCNHSDNHDSISTCARVGQYAEEIVTWCYDGATSNVKGQIYDGDYWSVMVHADNC